MDEQGNNEEQGIQEEQGGGLATDQQTGVEQGMQAIGEEAKEVVGEAAKEAGKKASKAAAHAMMSLLSAIASFIAANAIPVLIIVIIIIIIFSLVDAFTGLFNGKNKNNIIDTKAYITSDANGIILSSDVDITEMIEDQIDELGVDISQIGLGTKEQAMEYLIKFYKASVSTQLPYIEGVEKLGDKYVQGIVHIKRTSTTVEGATELEWRGYEEFTKEIADVNKDALKHYSIDANWNLCVATYTETKNSDNEVVNYTLSEIKIPYQNLIAQFCVPYRFITTMQQITGNPEYISKMCDMFTEDKYIDYMIFDAFQVTTDTNIYKYKIKYASGGTSSENSTTTTTTTITDTVSANVTQANTWLLDLKNEFKKTTETTYPYGESGQTTPLDDDTPSEGDESWHVEKSNTLIEKVDTDKWTQESKNMAYKHEEFLGLWRNATGKYKLGAEYVSESSGGKLVTYVIPNSNRNEAPAVSILNNINFLLELLAQDETTQTYDTIMRYMLYIYTGKNYGVTELDESLFNTDFFVTISPSVVGGSCEEKVWLTLRNAGYSEYAVAGAMGNMYHESHFYCNNLQNSGNTSLGLSDEEYTAMVDNGSYTRDQFVNDSIGYGLVQWTFSSRKAGLYDYAQQKGVSIADENMQIEYVLKELSGGYQDWANATSIQDATRIFCDQYERPAAPNYMERTASAQAFYDRYHGKTSASFTDGSTTGVTCPRYYQSDSRWADYPYNYKTNGTIKSGGCGACALAMAVSGLTGTEVTPVEIVEYLNSLNINTVNGGATCAKQVAQKYNLTYEHINRTDKAAIDAALDSNKVLIFSITRNGIYTGDGHFIMCNGRSGDSYYVLESGHYYETDKPYAFNQVFTAGVQGVFAIGR